MKAILEIDMPDICNECLLHIDDDTDNMCAVTHENLYRCGNQIVNVGMLRRGDNCPLKPVKEV